MNLIRNLVEQKRAAGTLKEPPQLAVTRPLEDPGETLVETAPADVETLEAPAPATQDVITAEPAVSGATALPQVEETSKKIWEFLSDTAEDTAPQASDAASLPEVPVPDDITPAPDPAMLQVPDPLTPRKPRQAGRVKTRLMGFATQNPVGQGLFDQDTSKAEKRETRFPVGWLVITKGPGRGEHFSLHNEVSTIGRGEDQTIVLNFGDDTVSRSHHAALAYDERLNACFVGHSGKANLVRLNGRPVLTTEQLTDGDTILVGQTELRFVEFCGARFTWATTEKDEDDHDIQI